MTPCRCCGTPTAESLCERCHGARRLVPDGGREADRWDPAVNEEWDSQARAAYLERQSNPDDHSASGEPATGGSEPAASSDPEAPTEESQPIGDELPKSEHQPDETGVTDRLSRRKLLLGGAGLAVAATGGRRLLSGGLDGAKGVAEGYIEAVANNDWETAGRLYHEDSRTRQSIDDRQSLGSYEDYLDDRGSLQFLSAIEPEIQDIYEWRYVRDPEEGDSVVRFAPDGVGEMDAWKQLIAIVSVDTETFYEARERTEVLDQVAGETTNQAFQLSSVQERTEWSLWNVSYPA